MRLKKALCFIICIFSFVLSFPLGKKDKTEGLGEESGEVNADDLPGSTEEALVLEGGETESERDLTLKDFATMHNSDFVSAMDYYNQTKMLLKKSECYPVCSLNKVIAERKKQLRAKDKKAVLLEEDEKDIKAVFMLSIVFPEMMRYSAFRDEIETRVTSVMYSCGSDSLICSIGYMQMKPNFASHIERCVKNYPDLEERYGMLNQEGKDFTFDQRRDRIKRLKTIDYQIQYLSAFIDYAVKRYNLSEKKPEYQLKILSTAYNAGLSYSIDDLEQIAKVKAFPNGTNAKGSMWNYSALSIQFYNYITNGFSFD